MRQNTYIHANNMDYSPFFSFFQFRSHMDWMIVSFAILVLFAFDKIAHKSNLASEQYSNTSILLQLATATTTTQQSCQMGLESYIFSLAKNWTRNPFTFHPPSCALKIVQLFFPMDARINLPDCIAPTLQLATSQPPLTQLYYGSQS